MVASARNFLAGVCMDLFVVLDLHVLKLKCV